jgi:hypothetical protein
MIYTGCMESLVHYKRILKQDGCDELLRKLIELDPVRGERYKELGTEIADNV